MRVLGVDPGLGVTGYGVVESAGDLAGERHPPRLLEAGAIRGRRSADLPARLVAIHDALREILEEFHPDAVALEDLFANYRFPRSALLMAHARGTICLAAAQAGVPVWSFAPAEVKNAVVGYGKASKEQVQEMVQHLFGLEHRPRPHDVADALALALTGLSRFAPVLGARCSVLGGTTAGPALVGPSTEHRAPSTDL
jgi:crossover junction endodeoxyribonuclease RuvC